MAKAAAAEETKAKLAPMDAPAGFNLRSSVSDAPWVAQEENNVCMGHLINRYEMQNQNPRRFYYQVELTADCMVREGKGDDAEVVVAKEGTIVNLNRNFKTGTLDEVEVPSILAGAAYDVWVKFGDKIKIGGGKTMWNITVRSKMMRPAKGPISAIPAADGEAEASDNPF